jgi:hypothetical protein
MCRGRKKKRGEEEPRPFSLPLPEALPPGGGRSYFLWHSSHFTGPFFSF